MRNSRFLVGAVSGTAVVAAIGGVVTYLLADKNVQHTTVDRIADKLYVKVDGHPAVHTITLEARIKGWYHPLPWVGRDIDDLSCPAHLKAVAGATGTCTARSDGERISIPVKVVEVGGSPEEPAVTWKFER
jgi:hypothetical protein